MGDDVLVATLDRELAPLVATILAYRACNMLEVYMQLQFMSNLIRQEADDQTSVMRNCSALTTLLHRYFAGAEVAVMDALLSASAGADRGNAVFGDDQVLSDLVLDSLPDRVAVITRDYRYLYSNAANNAYLNTKQMDLLGRHLSEFIGVERFEQRAKHKLDACFAGES